MPKKLLPPRVAVIVVPASHQYRIPSSNAENVIQFKVPYSDDWQYLSAHRKGESLAQTLACFKRNYEYAHSVSIVPNLITERGPE